MVTAGSIKKIRHILDADGWHAVLLIDSAPFFRIIPLTNRTLVTGEVDDNTTVDAIVGNLPALLGGDLGHIDAVLGDIQADGWLRRLHGSPFLVRSTDAAIAAQPCRCELTRLK